MEEQGLRVLTVNDLAQRWQRRLAEGVARVAGCSRYIGLEQSIGATRESGGLLLLKAWPMWPRLFMFLGREVAGECCWTSQCSRPDARCASRLEGALSAMEAAAEGSRKTASAAGGVESMAARRQCDQRVAKADAAEPTALCGDANGAACDQRGEGPHQQHGLAGAGQSAMRRGGRRHLARRRLAVCERVLEQPNPQDSFRTLLEPVLEDIIVGGFGAAEIEPTETLPPGLCGCGPSMARQWRWMRSGTVTVGSLRGMCRRRSDAASGVPLLDRELMYVRLNPRTHTPFGLGRLEVAFETMNQFLSANRYAGKLASNSVVQYALWLDEATPQQHERLIRWWQDEVEGTGQVPDPVDSANKPEVLRFAGGTDADLRLQWQEFLLRILAKRVRSAADAAWPPVRCESQHRGGDGGAGISVGDRSGRQAGGGTHHARRVCKALGWDDVEFVFNDLLVRDAAWRRRTCRCSC